MSIKDILKNSFLDGFANGFDIKEVLISLGAATLLALYIFFIYRLVTKKTFYSKTFNISLIAMAIITASIILTIQSNIVISLGMVGALSIVRFRTAIKEPLDLVFLYWSISIGIICGAGLLTIAVILSLLMSIVVLVMRKYPMRKQSMLLVVNSTKPENDKEIMNIVRKYSKYGRIKSKNMTDSKLDMIIEVKVDEESELIHEVLTIDGVVSAAILSHDGEVKA